MRIQEIKWDEQSVWHIARHAVDPEEVESVCFDGQPLVLKAKYNRYFALGQTGSGRYLAVIFEYIGRGKIKIITARPMSEAERRLFKRR